MYRRTAGLIVVFVVAFAAFIAARSVGCSAVESPFVVTPSVMVRMFRDSPTKAAELYAGRAIVIPLRRGQFRILNHDPVIVSDPSTDRDTRMTSGICTVVRDGKYRGDQCHFLIVIERSTHFD